MRSLLAIALVALASMATFSWIFNETMKAIENINFNLPCLEGTEFLSQCEGEGSDHEGY